MSKVWEDEIRITKMCLPLFFQFTSRGLRVAGLKFYTHSLQFLFKKYNTNNTAGTPESTSCCKLYCAVLENIDIHPMEGQRWEILMGRGSQKLRSMMINWRGGGGFNQQKNLLLGGYGYFILYCAFVFKLSFVIAGF